MLYPESMNKLIESFKKLPGIGEKTAERLTFSVLKFESEDIELFSKAIIDVNNKISDCSVCHHLTEEPVCSICQNKGRNSEILCIVEDSRDVISLEKLGTYFGKYHVLGNLISPAEGINPENINISTLINRIKSEKVDEIILALKSTIEGETTALYISKILEKTKVKVSKIAYGLPIGVDIEYVDALTLERALEDRKDVK